MFENFYSIKLNKYVISVKKRDMLGMNCLEYSHNCHFTLIYHYFVYIGPLKLLNAYRV